MTHGLEKSDRLIQPKKPSNKAEQSAAERAEGRSLAKGNLPQDDADRIQSRRQVNSALRRIRQAAEQDRRVKFTSLLHHIYAVDMLREAYFSLKREAAPGIDGQSWRDYGEDLEEHLRDLSGRLASPRAPRRTTGCRVSPGARASGNGRCRSIGPQ